MGLTQTIKLAIPELASRDLRERVSWVQLTPKRSAVGCSLCGARFGRVATFAILHAQMRSVRVRVIRTASFDLAVRRAPHRPAARRAPGAPCGNRAFDHAPAAVSVEPRLPGCGLGPQAGRRQDGYRGSPLSGRFPRNCAVLQRLGVRPWRRQPFDARVLAPAGLALLDIPIDHSLKDTYEDWSITSSPERAMTFGQFDRDRWFDRSFPDLPCAAGFVVDVNPYPPSPDEAGPLSSSDADQASFSVATRPVTSASAPGRRVLVND